MRKNFLFRFVTFYSSFSILLQSFLPFAYITPQIAFSQDSTQTTVTETVTPTAEPTVAPSVEPTVAPTSEPTVAPTAEPTVEAPPATPTEELSPTSIPTGTVEPSVTPTLSPTVAPTGQVSEANSTPAPTSESTNPTAVPATPTVTVSPTAATPLADEVVVAQIVKLDGSYADPNLVPTTWTDKLDYHPTEKVVVSGKNFIAGQTYSITISSTDDSAVTHNGTFVANNDGTFTYEYQLDGNYRPNYSVSIKDASGTVVASTQFTDSASVTTTSNNVSCMAENPKSPKNLNCTANDISLASVSGITINGHGCRFPGDTVNFTANWEVHANATSRYNVGVWFATAGQSSAQTGPANSCSVTSLPSSPSPFFDGGSQCGGINSGSNGTISITMTATCNPDSSGFLKLPYCTSWQENDHDSCTTPSDAVPGTASKCNCQNGFTIPITVPPSIEVVKSLSPTNDSGLFNLQVNGTTYANNIGNNGATGKQTANVGSNTIGETAGTNSILSGYSTSVICKDNHGAGAVVSNTGTNPWTLTAGNGQDILCTITNTRINNGSITIIKDANPNNAQDFAFTTTGTGLSNFSLDDDSDGTLSNTKVFSTLAAGIYTVAETAVSGWTQTSAICSDGSPVTAIALGAGENVTCTFTNTKDAKLTVTKTVTNDNGGTKVVSDFPLFVDSTSVTSGTKNTFSIGAHVVSETPDAGYVGSFGGDCDASGNVTLAAGDDKTCTIVNDDKAPALHLRKTVTNDNGGTALDTAWTLTATGTVISPSNLSGSTPVDSNNTGFKADTYTLGETGPTGYAASNWSCVGGTQVGNTIAVALGESATCTINNDDIAPSLTLVKTVATDNGGSAVAADWTLTATGPTSISGAGGVASDSTFDIGTYTLSESAGPTGYTAGLWSCVKNNNAPVTGSSITLSFGDSATCTINNDDQPATLTVVKSLTKDNGGTLACSDFSFKVNGGDSIPFEADCSNSMTVNAGTYTVVEDPQSGYTPTYSSCSNLLLGNGGSATCTITNDDQPATLIVKKVVVNDNGGTKNADDFTFSVNAGAATAFEVDGQNDLTVNAGTYSITEPAVAGYATTYNNCSDVVIPNGGTATCTITNNDIQPKLTVTKVVKNDNGGTNVIADFPLFVNATGVTSGVQNGFNAGTYTVSETGLATYASAISGDCATNGSITLALGDTKSCTITNDDVKPQLHLVKEIINDNGGTAAATDWTLTATGTKDDPTNLSGFTQVNSPNTFLADTYTLGESGPSGYSASDWVCTGGVQNGNTITVGLGEEATCIITNDDIAPKLHLRKIIVNNNGGTAALGDVTLTANGTGSNDISGTSPVDSGSTLKADTFALNESALTGYTASDWVCTGGTQSGSNITVGLNQEATCTITNDDIAPSLTLKKEVINDNGGDAVASEWVVSATGITNLSGNGIATSGATFSAGTYTLDESGGQGGYSAGNWSCTNDITVDTEEGSQITLLPGQNTVCTIVNNDIAPTITLIKELAGEEGIGELDFGLTIGDTSVTSGQTLKVDANTPIELNEAGLPGYKFDSLMGDELCPEALGGTVTLNEGDNLTCTITNKYVPPELTIAKFNTTWPSNTTPGNEVQFTLRLKLSKNNIKNLLVTDLPANGFKYKPGSYNVKIDGTDVTGSISEPVYHSPGKWNIGDVNLGDNEEVEILLSYTATVDPNIKPGLYKDLAWGYGCETEDCTAKVLALSAPSGTTDPGEVTDNFVGSKVGVDKEVQNTTSTDIKKEQKSTGEVLGASTSLPSTGASTMWLYIMSLLSGFGIISILMGLFLKKRSFKKITLSALVLVLALSAFAPGKPVQAVAPDNLTIRISEPKTPTNSLFNLVFVTLDLEGRDLTVKCYKKSPTDGGYSQFGSNISLLATGGNSGECEITESLLSQKGTYNFYTTVEASGEGPVQSQIVAVDYNNSEGPSTPTNYSKDHISSCQYKISFKTADDSGKTVKVEIYRNENTSFGLNSSTRVGTVTIGSNTDGSYTDSVPDCNKTYYYVIRAFDSFGNGSGVIGDSVVTVTSSTTTTTTSTTGTTGGGAIPVEGGANVAGESEVLGVQTFITPGASGSGRILGEQTEAKKSTLGKVLGAVTGKNMRPWYIAAVVLAIGILGYVIYRKKTQGGI